MKHFIKYLIIGCFVFQAPFSYSKNEQASWPGLAVACAGIGVAAWMNERHNKKNRELQKEEGRKKRELQKEEGRKNRELQKEEGRKNREQRERHHQENLHNVCKKLQGAEANNNPGGGIYVPLMGAGGLLSFLGPIGWAITGTTMFLVGMNQLSKYMEDKYIKSFSGDNIFSKAMCADRSTMPPLDKAIPVDWSVLEQSNLKIYKDGTATFWYSRVNDLGVYKSKEVSGRFALDVDYGTFIVGVDNQIFSVHTRGDDLVAIGVEPSKSGIHCPDPNYQLVYPLINQVALAKREAKTEAQVIGGGGSDRELTTKELNRIQGGFYCERIVHEMECGYHLPL